MEKKINIAELLKDCPSGMKLDCTLFEGLEFDSIVDNDFLPIRCRIKNSGGGYNVYNFTKYGCWVDMLFAKCVIFPKGKTTWEGYKWNTETKTLEKLPKFKVRDRIKEKQSNIIGEIIDVQKNKYDVKIDDKGLYVYFREQDNWELVQDKFNVNTLKPFDKVLVRDSNEGMWSASIFSHTWENKYICIGIWYNQCIPYEGNEHLLGITNDCDEYFKTWE